MVILDGVVSVLARHLWKSFEAASADPEGRQFAVLQEIVARAADTEWGRKYGFVDVRTPEQFRCRVPVMPYESTAPLWHQAFDGRENIAWPGLVRYFARTSGTTGGNKHIPVTADAVRSNLRAGSMLLACMVRRGGARSLAAGKIMNLSGSTSLNGRGPCLCGDASGIAARQFPWLVRRRHLPEPAIAATSAWEEKIDRIVERHLTSRISVLSACPSWAVMLFRQMRQGALARSERRQAIGDLWPDLAFFVSYGMAFEPYRRVFEEYIGRGIHYVDTYSSSEGGMTGIQEEPGGPFRLIVDNGVFFEFVPVERAGEADPPRRHIGEVEVGKDYALLLSSNGGIWAYPLGDVVRFESLRPPRIRFAGRLQLSLSAVGERLTQEMIEDAIVVACRETAATIVDYTIWPRFPSTEFPRPLHRWIVEFVRPPQDLSRFAAILDQTIRKVNDDYDIPRTDDYGMEPPLVIPVVEGTFCRWMKHKGKLGGQHKVPRLALDPWMGEELLEISRMLGGRIS